MTYKFVTNTQSKKVGAMPTSYSPRQTCPTSCSLKNNGCYGDNFPIRLHWNRYSEDNNDNWDEFVKQVYYFRKHNKEGLWRHNVVGDLVVKKNKIDAKKLKQLVKANRGGKVICYTHHHTTLSGKKRKLSEHNLNLIRYANNKGFTVNLSADTLEQADILSDTKIPTTVVLPFTKTQFEKMEVDLSEVKTPLGKKITICPEQTHNIKCLDCKLCSHNKRKTIIGFFKH